MAMACAARSARQGRNGARRDRFERPLGDRLGRSLDAITRSDVEDRSNRITEKHGWATANQCMTLLRSVYRRRLRRVRAWRIAPP